MNASRRRGIGLLLTSLATVAVLLAGERNADSGPSAAVGSTQASDPLATLGITPTGGAAPGYVPDQICGRCHPEQYKSYQEVGMARAFYRPVAEKLIEDFSSGPFFHAPSQRYYEMRLADERLLFRRFQRDPAGEQINLWEVEVDWIMGSGNHSRVYLFRSPAGEVYQLPLAWYSPGSDPGAGARWGMAPGFDSPNHFGLTRQVRRECMFCHNAYPEVPVGSDLYGEPHLFPEELPEGIGCQRCHGPGAEHLRAALRLQASENEVRSAIVNPGRLSPELRDAVCFGCHLQPSVALPGLRRFDRPDYSFVPGERLSDYLVQVDVVEDGKSREQRFEINHHPYRLMQSRCWQESPAGALSCLTCHDPHRKVPASERIRHYQTACFNCHQQSDCDLDSMAASAGPTTDADSLVDPQDCSTCHMPLRRTEDVVQVVMTDHLISRQPGEEELLAPLNERSPVLTDVVPLFRETAPKGDLWEIYRAAAVFRAGGGAAAVEHLYRMLARARPPELTPYLDLGRGLLRARQLDRSAEVLEDVIGRAPGEIRARHWLALVRLGQNRPEEALELLRRLIAEGAEAPEIQFNLGRLLLAYRGPQQAIPHLRRAVEMRPVLAAGWLQLGEAYTRLKKGTDAVRAYRQALAVDPNLEAAYLALAQALVERGKPAEARRYLEHGASILSGPEALSEALSHLAERDAGGEG